MISCVGNITNGVGYVIQNLGHYKTGARKRLYEHMREHLGNEKHRLELVQEEGLDSSPLSLQAMLILEARLEEIKRAEAGDAKAKHSKSEDETDMMLAVGASPWTNPLWVAGFVTYAFGSLLRAVALGFAPAALVAPLDGLTLVTNSIIAPMVLPEQLTRKDVAGAAVIIVGVGVCVVFGPANEVEWTTEQLVTQWGNTPMIVYTIIMVVSTYIVSKFSKRWQDALVESNDFNPDSGERMDLDLPNATLIAISYCWISATLAAYNGLFTSAWTIALMSSFREGVNYYAITPTCVSTAYFQFVAFIACNFAMELWKQRGLAMFDSLFFVPVFQVALVVLLVITTGIFYQDFEKMVSGGLFLFCVGVLLTCGGVGILSYRSEKANRDVTDMLWDALDNVEASWATHLKQMHEEALREKVTGRVSHFLGVLKKKVTRHHDASQKTVEELRDLETRDSKIDALGEAEAKDVVRELLFRMDSAVLAAEKQRDKKEKDLRRMNSGFASVAASQDVRGTALGTSVFALGSLANERTEALSERKKRHEETNALTKHLGGPSSRANSRANSRGRTPKAGSRPGSAARKRAAGATVHPETAVAAAGGGGADEGVGQGQLILHRAISEMQAVPEESEVGHALTISSSAPSAGSANMGDIPGSVLPPKPASAASPRLLPPIVDSSPAGAHIDFDAEAANGGQVPKEGVGPAKK